MTASWTDIHNHTLPGVDDGPKEMADALSMASLAAEDGTTTVLLTPHSRAVRQLVRQGDFLQRVQALRQAVAQRGLSLRFLVGMENYLEPDLPELVDEGVCLPVNGTRYILVEFPVNELLPVYADDTLFRLQLKGLTPVIVHPERCDALVARPELLEGFVHRGMLAQVTAGSLAGRLGKEYQKSAELMLRRGLVHVIASDGHMPRGPRAPLISEGVQRAARLVGEARATAMASAAPEAIVAGTALPL